MIVVDTSALIDALTGPRRSAPLLRSALEAGERLLLPSLVLYEWLRGPRIPEELTAQEALLPSEAALAFGPEEAIEAARLYAVVDEGRGREIDIAVAAHGLARGARIWTLNLRDFDDLPGVELFGT